MPGGMAAPAQLFGDLSRGQGQLRQQPVEDAAFAHAGISRKGRELSLQRLPQLLHPGPGLGAGGNHPEARLGVDAAQVQGLVQIRFVHAEDALHALVARNGCHPVNEEGLGNGVDVCGENHQTVHIGHRRADEAVFSGENGFHHSLFPLPCHLYQVPSQGGLAALAQDTPGLAGQHPLGKADLIKAAEGADNSAGFCFFSHQMSLSGSGIFLR